MVGDILCVHFYSFFFFWLCDMWDPSSLISNRTHAPCFGSSESSKVFKVHWTFREVPAHISRYPLLPLLIRNWSEVKLLSRVWLFATPSTAGFSIHGISQARVRNRVSPDASTAEVRASCYRQSGWIFASKTLDISIFRVFFLSKLSVFSKKQLLVSFLEAVSYLARVSGV